MHAEFVATETIGQMSPIRKGLPRWSEATIALLVLIFAAPLIALIGLTIAAVSSGPILFRQRRVGRYGRTFELYKLRTMKTSSDGPQITSGKDERITRLGRFLRHTKLDELPSFWNVLRGDMSLVGPRPEVPKFVRLDESTWQRILSVRPGLTDPVTLQLRNEADLLAKVGGDTEQFYVDELQPSKLKGYLAYLDTRDWRSDVHILLRTIAAIVVSSKASKVSVSDVTPGEK